MAAHRNRHGKQPKRSFYRRNYRLDRRGLGHTPKNNRWWTNVYKDWWNGVQQKIAERCPFCKRKPGLDYYLQYTDINKSRKRWTYLSDNRWRRNLAPPIRDRSRPIQSSFYRRTDRLGYRRSAECLHNNGWRRNLGIYYTRNE